MAPINLDEFETLAKAKLAKSVFDFFAGGAADELTLDHNREAFKQIFLVPRILKDTTHCNVGIKLLGLELAAPIMGAPSAFQRLADPAGEAAAAEALGEAGLATIISTMASTPLENIPAVCPSWFQIYVYKDRQATLDLVQRAVAAGYKGIVLTVDVPVMGKRERDIRNQFSLPPHVRAENFAGVLAKVSTTMPGSSIKHYTDAQFDRSLAWQDLDWIKSKVSLPLVLKGVMRASDALKAMDHGVDAIIVSNHGGRQLDGVPASIRLLPDIAEKTGGRMPLLLDGGVRRGTDVLKALALGASCVLLGRPLLWGLAVNGKQGVADLLEMLNQEFLEAMLLCGLGSIDEIREDQELIW